VALTIRRTKADNLPMSDIRPSTRGLRRRISPLAALTAGAALLTGLAIAGHSAQQAATRSLTTLTPPAATPTAAGAPELTPHGITPTADASADPSAVPGQGAAATARAATGPVSVRDYFDGGARQPVVDSQSRHPLRMVTAAGGTITYVPRAGGWALKFPKRCTATPSTCPRAILQGARDDSLNPGTRPLQYGAAVLMTRADTADGANVLQKGYSVGGSSQYKLQVDRAAGRPSCVVASNTTIYRAEWRYTVADGRWHALVCHRAGRTLTLYVDGVKRATKAVPASLSLVNAEPLRIGGKGVAVGNDQFAGYIDNAYVVIG
jgi:hypothetical protein